MVLKSIGGENGVIGKFARSIIREVYAHRAKLAKASDLVKSHQARQNAWDLAKPAKFPGMVLKSIGGDNVAIGNFARTIIREVYAQRTKFAEASELVSKSI